MIAPDHLRAMPLFAGLSNEDLAGLAADVQERRLGAGEVLFRQGDSGHDCFVILSGQIEVITYLGGEELRLEVHGPGRIIGEMALIDHGPRSATLRSLNDSWLVKLTERHFFTLMHRNPETALEVLREATTRQRRTSQSMIAGLEQKNAELRRAYHELQVAQAELIRLNRIEEELAVARRIQERFLPRSLPQPPGWQVAAFNRGAQEVGGDFFDCIELPNGRLGLVVADVSGKGVPAALFVALARSLVRAASQAPWAFQGERLLTPEDLLASALRLTNDYIVREHSESSMFITMFYGLLDPQTGALAYINAGHNPPLIIRPDGAARELADGATLPIGIVPGQRFELAYAQVAPGEMFVAFSDGITEAMNSAGEPFDDGRLLTAIRAYAALPAAAMVGATIAAVDSYVGNAPQADDITLLVVRRVLQVAGAA